MEGNHLPPPTPTQPIFFVGQHQQRYEYMAAGITLPITISMHNGTKLYFIVTRDNVTIIAPIHNEPQLRIIPETVMNLRLRRNNNNNNNNNNNSNNNNNNNSEALQFLSDRETLVLNLHHFPIIESGHRERQLLFLDVVSELHGLTLRDLPTIPSHIHITSNNRSFALHVTAYNTIEVIYQPLPIHPPLNHDNFHAINKPILPPFILVLPFNNRVNSTIVTIFIEFHINNNIFIFANLRMGFFQWAAIIDSISFTPAARNGDRKCQDSL